MKKSGWIPDFESFFGLWKLFEALSSWKLETFKSFWKAYTILKSSEKLKTVEAF